MSDALLDLDKVTVALGRNPVVRGVTAGFHRGAFVALVGPNGAGKTTLLRAMAGLMPHGGSITLEGAALSSLAPARRARRIGYLPQGHQTHWPLPVRDIVALGRFPHGATDPRRLGADDQAIVAEAMRQTGVTHLAEQPATRLSGGEKARVALARVLALGSPVILADEPTASLDPRYQLEIMALLQRIAAGGALVIAVTHDLGHAAHFADHVLVLDGGQCAAIGPPAAVLTPELLAGVFKVRALTVPGGDNRLIVPWESLQ